MLQVSFIDSESMDADPIAFKELSSGPTEPDEEVRLRAYNSVVVRVSYPLLKAQHMYGKLKYEGI